MYIDKIWVKAKEGCVCPAENHRDPMITDIQPREVSYNDRTRGLIADGSLLVCKAPKQEEPKQDKKKN